MRKICYVLNLQCKIPQFQVFLGEVNMYAQILEYELKVRGILISIVVSYMNIFEHLSLK